MKAAFSVLAAVLFLVACASQPAAAQHAPGLLVGFLHGFTAILSLIGSLFLQIRIYEFPNGGFWYDFGFIAGFSTSLLTLLLTFIARIGGMVT